MALLTYTYLFTFRIYSNFFILFSTKGSVSEVDNGCLQKPTVKSRVLDQPKSPQKIAKAQSFLRPIPKLEVPLDDTKVKNVPSPIPLPKGVTSKLQFWFNFFLLKIIFITQQLHWCLLECKYPRHIEKLPQFRRANFTSVDFKRKFLCHRFDQKTNDIKGYLTIMQQCLVINLPLGYDNKRLS